MDTAHLIYVFRHGQTAWNREGRIQGHLDVPLNDTGREEAHRLAFALRRIRLDSIFTSDLSRAVHTAELALAEASRRGWHPLVPIVADARFREVAFGKLQGLTRAEIREKFGDTVADHFGGKVLSDELLRDMGSENAGEILTRFFAALTEHSAAYPAGSRFGVATHGGVIRRLLYHGAGIDDMPAPVPNAAVLTFRFIPGTSDFRLVGKTELGDS